MFYLVNGNYNQRPQSSYNEQQNQNYGPKPQITYEPNYEQQTYDPNYQKPNYSYSYGPTSKQTYEPNYQQQNYQQPNYGPKSQQQQTQIDIPSGIAPIQLNFQSQSSPITLTNQHIGAKGTTQYSKSFDKPHKLYHHVIKPVYHEIREVVVPNRKIVQIIKPATENLQTYVPNNRQYQQNMKSDYYDKEAY